MTVSLSRARSEDVGLVAPLFDAYRAFYGQPPDPGLAHEFLRKRLAGEESVVFLALEGSTGVGFAQLYSSFSSVSARRTYVPNDLFVASEARGRGVGRTLLEEARRYTAGAGAIRLELATVVDNLPARRLYEEMGWEKVEGFYHYHLNV